MRGKIKEEKQDLKAGNFTVEILLFVLFIVIDIVVCILKYEEWFGISMLIIGLLSLFLNDIHKILDLAIAIIWSGCYAFFSLKNGFMCQAVLFSGFYMFQKVYAMFVVKKTKMIVIEKKRLKTFEWVTLALVVVFAVVGSYFLSMIWLDEKLGLIDAIAAVMLCVSLYMQLIKCEEYFVLRLVAMGLIIILWVLKGFKFDFELGTASTALMWVAFLIFDNVRLSRYSTEKLIETNIKLAERENAFDLFDNPEYKEAQKKYERENPNKLPDRSVGIDKEDKRR